MDGGHFRKYYCYNIKTNDILKKNEVPLGKLYDSFTNPKKKYITMPEAKEFARSLDLNASEMMVGAMYSECMMTILDNLSDPTICQQMKYVEFLVFLCRITHENYSSSEHHNEALYVKLDHMLPKFLDRINLECAFQYGEKFVAEYKKDLKKMRRKLK